jgi:hypothetical protein
MFFALTTHDTYINVRTHRNNSNVINPLATNSTGKHLFPKRRPRAHTRTSAPASVRRTL